MAEGADEQVGTAAIGQRPSLEDEVTSFGDRA